MGEGTDEQMVFLPDLPVRLESLLFCWMACVLREFLSVWLHEDIKAPLHVKSRVGYRLNFIDSDSDSAYRFRFFSIPM